MSADVIEGEVVEPGTDEPTVAALAVREPAPLVRPAADLAEIERAFNDYDALCKRLLAPSDYQKIGDKKFRKRSGWRKLGVAFSIDYELVEKNLVWGDDGKVTFAEFTYRAVAPNGRHVDGWGACDRFERCCTPGCSKNHRHCPARNGEDCPGWTHFSHANHDIPATAETRAKNRAAADLFGMGEVSAEEVVGQGTPGEAPTRRRPASPAASGTDGSQSSPGVISEPQLRRLMAIARGRDCPTEEVDQIVREIAGVDSKKDIPRSKYEAVCAAVEEYVPF